MDTIHQVNAIHTIDMLTEAHYDLHSSIVREDFPQVHDFYEFSLVLKGELTLIIDKKAICLSENEVIFIRPGEVHDKYQETDSLHLNFAFSMGLMDSLFDYLGIGASKKIIIDTFFSKPQKLSNHLVERINEHLEELNTISFSNRVKKKAIVRLILIEIITNHYLELIDESMLSTSYHSSISWFNQLLIEINKKENFIQGPSVLSSLSNKNQSYICRVFKKELGVSPSAYCNQLRLNYAANLMIHSDYDILDIAYDSGFQSLSHFYSYFQKQYNLTPKKFRERYTEYT
ncbi:helix-turn-helix domain-containing protein [Vagococcus fluvialis]|uniref:helix-turn-helix domain-containing protein n=1 Tax=Vagococcus fluvialis TaxID=2738 RepID=UPI003B59A0BD